MTDVVSQYVSGRTVQEQMCELMKLVSTVNGKSVRKIEGSQSDDTVTVTVTYEDDRTDVFSFQSTPGVTVDTDQTISGMKVFSAASTQFTHDVDVGGDLNAAGALEIGENADIDGDVNCQNATIAGNLKVAGAVQDDVEFTGDNVEIGSMSLEKDGQMTVISNSNGIKIADDTEMVIPDTQTGLRDKKAVNANRLQNDLDAYTPMIRNTGAQTKDGTLTLNDGLVSYPYGWHAIYGSGMAQGQYVEFAKIRCTSPGAYHIIEFMQNSNTAMAYGRIMIHEQAGDHHSAWIERISVGGNTPLGPHAITIATDGTDLYLIWKRESLYGSISGRVYVEQSYGTCRKLADSHVTWYPIASARILSDLSSYTATWEPE